MASVYKPKGSKKYRIAYYDRDGKRRSVPGYRDKAATQAKSKQIERNAEREAAGLTTNQVVGYERTVADYLYELTRRGTSEKSPHYTESRRILNAFQREAAWTTIGQIRREQITEYLRKMHEDGKAPRTQNRHLETIRAFLNFCVHSRWLEESPIKDMQMAKVGQAGKRHRRRAFTADELQKLLHDCTPCPTAMERKQADKRAIIYAVAAFSGLRKGEIGRLTKEDLDPCQKRWTLRSEITKNGKAERLPMLPNCAKAIFDAWQQAEWGELIFKTMPETSLLNKDMARAGIKKLDSQGRVLDFHCLRYTFCTLLAQKLPIQKVMALMRHHDIRLTANLYLDLGLSDAGEDDWGLSELELGTKDEIDASKSDDKKAALQ